TLCRLVSAVHLTGERGRPAATVEEVAPYLADGHLVVMLGPDSSVGQAVGRRREDLATALVDQWRELLPADNLVLELTSHRLGPQGGDWGPGSTPHAARTAGFA